MPNEIIDLWSNEILNAEMVTPAAILRQQASLLGPKTQNLVEAEVQTVIPAGGGILLYFNLVVPALSGYKYRLFALQHGPELYPAFVVEGPSAKSSIPDEDKLLSYLGAVLGSPHTTRIVAALKAQAKT